MTIMAGSSQLQSHHRAKHHRDGSEPKVGNRSSSRNEISQRSGSGAGGGGSGGGGGGSGGGGGGESESDTSCSPINDFSNAPTYRIPAKSSRGTYTSQQK